MKYRQPLLEPSLVLHENGTKLINEARTSKSAFLSRNDPVSQCIMERASELQGMVNTGRIENLQITAYKEGQRYQPHFDWFDNKVQRRQGGSNRGSTFFVTLEADCKNCGTRFPQLQVNWKLKDASWCKFVDCEDTQALTAHAVPGAALFWRNLNASGLGDENTLHEGLPLRRGTKIGLNIWTIEYP